MHTHDQITLAGMRFHALVGVLAHEREIVQPLEADVAAERARRARRGELDA